MAVCLREVRICACEFVRVNTRMLAVGKGATRSRVVEKRSKAEYLPFVKNSLKLVVCEKR